MNNLHDQTKANYWEKKKRIEEIDRLLNTPLPDKKIIELQKEKKEKEIECEKLKKILTDEGKVDFYKMGGNN
jgi:hypothetical protein